MKNKLLDLNNHLFASLERLNDEDLKGEELKDEINRSRAVSGIAKEIINGGRLMLDAQSKLQDGEVDSVSNLLGVEVKNA